MQLQSGLSERLGGSFAGPLSPRKLPTRLGNTPHRTNAVLAPSEVSREKRTTPKLGQSRGLAGALLSALRLWERQDQQKPKPEELVVEAAQRDPLSNDIAKIDAKAAPTKAKIIPPPPAIDPFLRPVGVMELRYIRMLSNLCAQTYFMSKLTPSSIFRRHGIRLVTSSLACAASTRLPQISPLQAMIDGDATAADVPQVLHKSSGSTSSSIHEKETSSSISTSSSSSSPLPGDNNDDAATYVATAAALKKLSKEPPLKTHSSSTTKSSSPSSSADVVTSSLSAAASAAATAASSAAGSVYTAANNITAFTASYSSSPLASVASQLQHAAAAGQASTVATIATVSAAVLSGRSAAAAGAPGCVSPTEWFVADDEAANVRYFVIQGSDSMDHWRVNLTFDPVEFEDKALGVKVHRGVYETAMLLYDRFLPLVQDHIASSPTARIAFTGHSLGGSLATLLMMMYVRRGVVSAANLAPVYTFGAPAIFCEGACGTAGCGACPLPDSNTTSSDTSTTSSSVKSGGGGVLDKLGLPTGAVRNIIMHKDIVPRAFACDYSLVADLLRRVGESFREHHCLSGSRRVMFNFVGKMLVLQPSSDLKFVGGEGYHAMLPPQAGLFVVREPQRLWRNTITTSTAVEEIHSSVNGSAEMHHHGHHVSNLPAGSSSSLSVPLPLPSSSSSTSSSSSSSSSSTASTATPARPTVASAEEALWQLMNSPHPLDILGDAGAYGDTGSISRYHNPDNYTRALGGVLRSRGAPSREIVRRAKENGVRFKPPVLVPSLLHEEAAPLKKKEEQQQHHLTGGKMSSPAVTRPTLRRVTIS